jgi:hypothetical protein
VPELADLIPGPGKREIVFGGTRAGKSSYMDWEARLVQKLRPSAMQILVDTKPRFRAEKESYGPANRYRRNAAYRYKSWAKGPVVPNSVVVDLWDRHPFRGLWRIPGEIAIMQSGDAADWRRMLQLLRMFAQKNIKDRERRVQVDEVMDFYGRNTWGIDPKNDVFYHLARAGGERNIGLSLGAQKVNGLPPLIIDMASVVVLFHLRNDAKDMRILNEHGIPGKESPRGDYVFQRYEIQPGGTASKPFTGKCVYPQSYLDQLAA